MPYYIYRCENGHESEIIEAMLTDIEHVCLICNTPMQRRPQPVMVNWNGLKPSEGELSDNVKEMIADAPRKRNEMQPHKSERLINTEARLNE